MRKNSDVSSHYGMSWIRLCIHLNMNMWTEETSWMKGEFYKFTTLRTTWTNYTHNSVITVSSAFIQGENAWFCTVWMAASQWWLGTLQRWTRPSVTPHNLRVPVKVSSTERNPINFTRKHTAGNLDSTIQHSVSLCWYFSVCSPRLSWLCQGEWPEYLTNH